MTPDEMLDTIHGPAAVPAGADITELCTSPTPNGRSCLQRVTAGCLVYACVDCQELLVQLLASVGAES